MHTENLPNKRPRLSHVGQTQVEPSIVLSVHPLPSGTSYVDLHDAFSRFGYISYASCIEGGTKGLVEFEMIESAKKCMNFSVQNTIGVKGQRVGVNYSEIERIHRSQMESTQPTNALIIAVSNVKEVIDDEVIRKICSPHGEISQISTVSEVPLKILVHFNNLESAKKAKRDLNGVDVYQGCCDMHVEFSTTGSLFARATNESQSNINTDNNSNQTGNEAKERQVHCSTGNLRIGGVSDLNTEVVRSSTGDFCNTREEFGSHGFSAGGFSNSAPKQFNTSEFSYNFSSDSGNQATQEVSHNPASEELGNAGFATQGFSSITQNGFSEQRSARKDGSNFRGRDSNFGKQGCNRGSLISGGRAPQGFGTNDGNFRRGISQGCGRRGGNSSQSCNRAPLQNSYRNQIENETEDHQLQCDDGNLRSTGDFCNSRQEFGSDGFSSSGINGSAYKTLNTSAFSQKFSSDNGNQAAQGLSHNLDFEELRNDGFATQGFASSTQKSLSEQSGIREGGSNFRQRDENFEERGYDRGSLNSGGRALRRFGANGSNFRGEISCGSGRRGENFGVSPQNSYSDQTGNEAENRQFLCNTGNLRSDGVSDVNAEVAGSNTGNFCNTREEFGSRGFFTGGFSNSASKQFNTSAFSHNFSSDSGNKGTHEISHSPDFDEIGDAGFATPGFSSGAQNSFSEQSSARKDRPNFRGSGSNFRRQGYNRGSLNSGGRAPQGFGTNESDFRGGISHGRGNRDGNFADASQKSSLASGDFSSPGFGSGGQYSDHNRRGNGRGGRGRNYRGFNANGFGGNRENQRDRDFFN